MGLFDAFTGDPAREAADRNAALYAQYGTNANNLFGQYGTTANAALDTGYNTATGAIGAGTAAATGAINAGTGQAAGALGTARSDFAPLSALGTKYGGATGLYLDALGVNGPGGTTRAQGAYTTSPGYQFQVDEATKAAANKAASLGIAGSGNTLDEIRNRAQGIAKSDYGSYLDRLGGFVSPELAATSGAATGTAGVDTNLANLYSGQGTALAGIYGQDAAARAGLASADATNRVGVAGNVTQGQAGVGRDVTTGTASANNAAAQADIAGSQNFWNSLLNLGSTAASFATGVPAPRASNAPRVGPFAG